MLEVWRHTPLEKERGRCAPSCSLLYPSLSRWFYSSPATPLSGPPSAEDERCTGSAFATSWAFSRRCSRRGSVTEAAELRHSTSRRDYAVFYLISARTASL